MSKAIDYTLIILMLLTLFTSGLFSVYASLITNDAHNFIYEVDDAIAASYGSDVVIQACQDIATARRYVLVIEKKYKYDSTPFWSIELFYKYEMPVIGNFRQGNWHRIKL